MRLLASEAHAAHVTGAAAPRLAVMDFPRENITVLVREGGLETAGGRSVSTLHKRLG